MVIRLADKSENAARRDVDDAIRDAEIEIGKHRYNKAIVILASHGVNSDGDEHCGMYVSVGGLGINDLEAQGLLAMAAEYVRASMDWKDAEAKE